MTITMRMRQPALIVVAVRRKKLVAVPVFLLSFVFVLGMGYLSSKDFTIPAMNWLAEGGNTIGQGAFLVGAKLLADAQKQPA